jgi:homoserine O-acetyltransferase
MVALEMAAVFPDLVAGVLTIGATATLSAALRAMLASTWEATRGGGLRKARIEWLRRHYDKHALVRRLGDGAAVEAFLAEEAEDFLEGFDARCYAGLAQAYGAADLRDALGKIQCRSLLVAGQPDDIAPATRVREAYHRVSAAGSKASYYEVPSGAGHAGLLEEIGRIKGPVREFLTSLD